MRGTRHREIPGKLRWHPRLVLDPWERRLSSLLLSPVLEHVCSVAHLLLLAMSRHLIQIRGQQLIIWRYRLHKALSTPVHRMRLDIATHSSGPHHGVLELMGREATPSKGSSLESLLMLRVKCGPLLLGLAGEHLLPL